MEGIAHARAQGKPLGRQATLTRAQQTVLRQQRTAGVPVKDLMQQYGLSKASVYRYLAQGYAEREAQAAD